MRRSALATLAMGLACLSFVVSGASRADDNKVWKATANDIKAACRLDEVGKAQEAFKKNEGVYAKSLEMLSDHKLLRKETASGIFDGYKYSMTGDEKSFKVVAAPNVADKGFWTYMVTSGKKVRLAYGKEPTDKDNKVATAIYDVDSKKEWQKGDLSISEKQELHVATEGEWHCGNPKTWKPCGAEGTDQKAALNVDYRIFKGDKIQLGCLCTRIEGMEKGKAWVFEKGMDCLTVIAPKAGCPEFRINETDVSSNSGTMKVYCLVMQSANKEND